MGYYTLPLCPESQKICTTVLPFGKLSYARLVMGWAGAPYAFQSRMDSIFGHSDFVLIYIDDLTAITRVSDGHANPWKTHMMHVQTVLKLFSRDHGMQVNHNKTKFFAIEAEYLGYKVSQTGICPIEEKVQAILRVVPLTNRRLLRRFLGMLQIYREM